MQNLIGAIQQQAVFAIEGAIALMFFDIARQKLRSPRTLASRDRVEGDRSKFPNHPVVQAPG